MPVRLGYIVTEFPKTTETFIYRELLELHRAGHEIRLYHLTPFRKHEVVHDFARPVLDWAEGTGYLGCKALGALGRGLVRKPGAVLGMLGRLVRGGLGNPAMLAKSLLILPKCLYFAEQLQEWGADHVHAGFATHPATCAWMIGRMTAIPYSVSCHAHDIFVSRSMLDFKLGEAECVRPISRFNQDYLQEKIPRLRTRRFAVIHIGVDLESIQPTARSVGEEFRVLYVGSLEVRKGVNDLLAALAGCADELGAWRCDVMGDGPVRGELENQAQALGLTGRVVFHGKQPVREIYRAYSRCHVLAVPSIIDGKGRTEGIPTVLIEALAHQRPVISTRVSGIPELVRPGDTGWLVEAGDPAALAAALLEIRRDPAEADRRAANGRRLVEDEFDLVTNVQRLVRECLSDPS